MNILEAYEWAVKKWEWLIEHEGDDNEQDLVEAIPELLDFPSQCAYCELFTTRIFSEEFQNCLGCPLNLKEKGYSPGNYACTDDLSHPFKKWGMKPTRVNAQRVLNLIINTKPYGKVNDSPGSR